MNQKVLRMRKKTHTPISYPAYFINMLAREGAYIIGLHGTCRFSGYHFSVKIPKPA